MIGRDVVDRRHAMRLLLHSPRNPERGQANDQRDDADHDPRRARVRERQPRWPGRRWRQRPDPASRPSAAAGTPRRDPIPRIDSRAGDQHPRGGHHREAQGEDGRDGAPSALTGPPRAPRTVRRVARVYSRACGSRSRSAWRSSPLVGAGARGRSAEARRSAASSRGRLPQSQSRVRAPRLWTRWSFVIPASSSRPSRPPEALPGGRRTTARPSGRTPTRRP